MIRFLIALIPACLFATEAHMYSLSTFAGESESLVAGCVNPLTGDYYIQAEPFTVNCVNPIVVPRIYIAHGASSERGGYSLFPHIKLKLIKKTARKNTSR